jgi:hypothetical protein
VTACRSRRREHGAPVLDLQALDRNPFEVEAEFRERPGDPTGAVEPGPEFGPLQPGLGDAPFATHQGAQRKLDPQGARADLAALVRAAELDAVQRDGWGGSRRASIAPVTRKSSPVRRLALASNSPR